MKPSSICVLKLYLCPYVDGTISAFQIHQTPEQTGSVGLYVLMLHLEDTPYHHDVELSMFSVLGCNGSEELYE